MLAADIKLLGRETMASVVFEAQLHERMNKNNLTDQHEEDFLLGHYSVQKAPPLTLACSLRSRPSLSLD